MKTKFCSIIIASYVDNEERDKMFRTSLDTLHRRTKYPYELIVVDNGGNKELSQWLSSRAGAGVINTYIRNKNNMHFGYARNQGLKLAHGDYICIADNDILYYEGWLTKCVDVLEAHPDKKIYATPMPYPMSSLNHRYHAGYLDYKGESYELHQRAGSNCFVMRKKDFEEVGEFTHHRIAGSYWTDAANRAGYLACVLPDLRATDMGLRKGYDLKKSIPINLTLSDGTEVYFNEDEFKKKNPSKEYYA